jgi:hypothetical protein
MKIFEKIDLALKDNDSREFLIEQLNTIRENISKVEKKISYQIIFIISLIGISILITAKNISNISLFGTTISEMNLVLLVLPCIISYYNYSLINKILLRSILNKLFSKLIKSKYPKIIEYDLDDLLITNLDGNTEVILLNGMPTYLRLILNTLEAPFVLFFQYIPFTYSLFLTNKLFNKGSYSTLILWICLLISIVFLLRSIFLTIAWIKQQGFKKLIIEILTKKPNESQ